MDPWYRRFLGSSSLSHDLTDFELKYFFTLSEEERAAVKTRYKRDHRIAAAIQVGFLKSHVILARGVRSESVS